ncbi:MAG: LysM peptidoglycan-binding domain-containing protein, partial [Pontimonas sp.]
STTVSKLVDDNSIQNRDRIFVGQRLKVGAQEVTMTYHRSQDGDTLTRISERRSVPLDRLLSLNSGRSETSAITVGELIRLS